ncbi:hypothetical protein BGZ94_006378, partial [Podila epigama]
AWYDANRPPRTTVAPTPTTTVAPVTTTTTTTTTTVVPSPTEAPLDPAFPFKPDGPCVKQCNLVAGQSMFPEYSEDPTSPYFWRSLALSYVPGADNQVFMGKSGKCITGCPKEELTLYSAQFGPKRTWFNANKPVTTPTTAAPTTTTTVVVPTPTGNPSYPFLPNGPCVDKCMNDVGKALFPNYSEDPASPYFWESMDLSYNRGTPATIQFMTDTGMCFGRSQCPKEELDLYSNQWTAQKAWYDANRPPRTTVAPTPTTAAPVTTTTAAPATTTTSGP